jgi:predicted component of type VI protein secretion system
MVKMKLMLLLLATFYSGCTRPICVSEAEPAITLTMTSTKSTNDGTPFYVVLKFTDFPHFLVDDYQTIADLSASSNLDPASFMSVCLIPGKTERRIVVPPPDQSIAIYCLFTECGEEWKHLIDARETCQEVTIALGEHEINSVEMGKSSSCTILTLKN